MSNKIFRNIKNENGQAALLMVLIVLMMLLFVGLFLTDTVSKQIKVTKQTFLSRQELQATLKHGLPGQRTIQTLQI